MQFKVHQALRAHNLSTFTVQQLLLVNSASLLLLSSFKMLQWCCSFREVQHNSISFFQVERERRRLLPSFKSSVTFWRSATVALMVCRANSTCLRDSVEPCSFAPLNRGKWRVKSRTVKDGQQMVQAMVAMVGAVLGRCRKFFFLPAPRVCRDAPAPPLTHPHAWTLLCATNNNPVNNRMDAHFSSKHKLKNASEW